MPLVMVRCEDCGAETEHRVGVISGELHGLLCLACSSPMTRRIPTAANVPRSGRYSFEDGKAA